MPARRLGLLPARKKASRTSGRGPDRQKPYPILEPPAELYPARIYLEGGQRNVSTCCQQSFFGILLNGSILPSVCFSNLS